MGVYAGIRYLNKFGTVENLLFAIILFIVIVGIISLLSITGPTRRPHRTHSNKPASFCKPNKKHTRVKKQHIQP